MRDVYGARKNADCRGSWRPVSWINLRKCITNLHLRANPTCLADGDTVCSPNAEDFLNRYAESCVGWQHGAMNLSHLTFADVICLGLHSSSSRMQACERHDWLQGFTAAQTSSPVSSWCEAWRRLVLLSSGVTGHSETPRLPHRPWRPGHCNSLFRHCSASFDVRCRVFDYKNWYILLLSSNTVGNVRDTKYNHKLRTLVSTPMLRKGNIGSSHLGMKVICINSNLVAHFWFWLLATISPQTACAGGQACMMLSQMPLPAQILTYFQRRPKKRRECAQARRSYSFSDFSLCTHDQSRYSVHLKCVHTTL